MRKQEDKADTLRYHYDHFQSARERCEMRLNDIPKSMITPRKSESPFFSLFIVNYIDRSIAELTTQRIKLIQTCSEVAAVIMHALSAK